MSNFKPTIIILTMMSGFLFNFSSSAQNSPNDEVPQQESFFSSPSFQLLDDGFSVYKDSGRDAAMDVWLKDSPLLVNTKQLEDQLDNLASVEDFYGKFSSYDYLNTISLTTNTKLIYLIINYENGPLFSRFVIYRTNENKWVTTSFSFNTEIEYVVPEKFINDYLAPFKTN